MDTTELETLGPKLIEEVKIYNRTSGNSFVKTPQIIDILFPQGIMGRTQDAITIGRILDQLSKVANAPVEATSLIYQKIAAYALSAIKAAP